MENRARGGALIPLRRQGCALWCAAALALGASASAAPVLPPDAPEQQLLAAVAALNAGRLEQASQALRALVAAQPNFRLAQLLYGDLLAMRSGTRAAPPATDPELKALLEEFRVRVADASALPAAGRVPDDLLRLSPATAYAVVVDLPRSRLYVLHNGADGLRVIRSYYAAIARDGYGKTAAGDLRTPVGIYHVTGFKPGRSLPALYGAGAYPVNYPNPWDRRHGRTGSGIWLHGVPFSTYARPPRTSEGCVVLSNDDLLALKPVFAASDDRTPVVFADQLSWVEPQALAAERSTLMRAIHAWQAAWSARDTAAYLAFYAADFRTADGMARNAFAAYKRRVNASKRYIHVAVRDLNLIRYPGAKHLVLAEFTQDYRSDDYVQTSRKQQYWRQQPDGRWQIELEASR